jgi:hypothetical protein
MSEKEIQGEEEIQIVRSGATLSLSGQSTITYDIGSKGEDQYVRISGNSASGLFCKDWISLADIQQLLEGSAKVTSKTLQPVYAGKSANSPGFLLAALVHEKLCTTGNDTTGKESVPAETSPEVPLQKKPAKVKK